MPGETLQDKHLPMTRLRQLLGLAESDSLGFAMAFDDAKKDFVLMVDKRLTGKKVAEGLRADAAKEIDLKSVRFGNVRINQAEDPGTVKFQTNRSPLPGTIPVLVKLVKKAGYQAAVIDTNPALENDAPPLPGATAAESGTTTASPPPAPPPPPSAPPPPPPPPDGRTVLAALARRIGGVTDPALKERLAIMARDAGAKLAGGAPITAELKAIGAALATAPAAAGANGAAEAPKASDEPKVALAKSSTLWRTCRTQLHGKLDTLKDAILNAYADEPDVQGQIRGRLGALDRVFVTLDDRLDTALDNAMGATTPEARKGFVDESRAVIGEYTDLISRDPLIAQLDDNPFGVDMKFRETLDRVLPALTGLAQSVQ